MIINDNPNLLDQIGSNIDDKASFSRTGFKAIKLTFRHILT